MDISRASQHPVVLRSGQAHRIFGRSAVRHAVASGRWQSPARGVVVRHNGPMTPAERLDAALAACPPRSALGGLTALEVDGLEGFRRPQIHLVLPEGARRPTILGITTHWSTLVEDVDVHPTRTPRRTRPARSIFDAATWARSDREARAIVLASFQQGLVDAADMRTTGERRGTVGRSGIVRESVLDALGGLQSLPERDFDALLVLAGLPTPTRQRTVQTRSGRYHLDVGWDAFGVGAEIHGLPHHGVVNWSDDLHRANEIVIDGPRLLFFTSYAVRHEQVLVVDQLVRALRAGGWTGTPKPLDLAARRRKRLRAT